MYYFFILENIPSAADILVLPFLFGLLVSPQLIREPCFIFYDAGWKEKNKEIFLHYGLNKVKIVLGVALKPRL